MCNDETADPAQSTDALSAVRLPVGLVEDLAEVVRRSGRDVAEIVTTAIARHVEDLLDCLDAQQSFSEWVASGAPGIPIEEVLADLGDAARWRRPTGDELVEPMRGGANTGMTTDELMELLRGED